MPRIKNIIHIIQIKNFSVVREVDEIAAAAAPPPPPPPFNPLNGNEAQGGQRAAEDEDRGNQLYDQIWGDAAMVEQWMAVELPPGHGPREE